MSGCKPEAVLQWHRYGLAFPIEDHVVEMRLCFLVSIVLTHTSHPTRACLLTFIYVLKHFTYFQWVTHTNGAKDPRV